MPPGPGEIGMGKLPWAEGRCDVNRHRDIGRALLVLAALAVGTPGWAQADKPAATGATPLTSPAPKDGSPPSSAADSALRRVPPQIAARADRAFCRDQAAKRRLFGLGRHRFLTHCRRARRKGTPIPPAR